MNITANAYLASNARYASTLSGALGLRPADSSDSSPALPVDSFTSNAGQGSLGILSPRQALALMATTAAPATPATPAPVDGTNIGELGKDDPAVRKARKHAVKVAGKRVDWSHPETAIRNLSQFDGKGGNNDTDPVRCGAAVVVAAGILNGPEAFQAGLKRIRDRAEQVITKIGSDSAVWGSSPELARRAQQNLENAWDRLFEYGEKDPRTLTNADMSKIQDAIYTVAHADQLISINGQRMRPEAAGDAFLTTNAVGEYYKLMTGAEAPSHNGRTVQPYRVQDAAGRGHFVLGDENGNVAYNPWPVADGKAYSAEEGRPAPKIGRGSAAGQLDGMKVSDHPHNSLPSRA